jgi:hypothetical protein
MLQPTCDVGTLGVAKSCYEEAAMPTSYSRSETTESRFNA